MTSFSAEPEFSGEQLPSEIEADSPRSVPGDKPDEMRSGGQAPVETRFERKSPPIAPVGSELQRLIRPLLMPGEVPAAWLAIDLTNEMRFEAAVAVVTDRRILIARGGQPPTEIRLTSDLRVHFEDHGATGLLEVHEGHVVKHRERFTAACMKSADRFVQVCARLLTPAARATAEKSNSVVSVPAPAEEEFGPTEPPKTAKTIWRLILFARPWVGLISLGLALTMASTACTLIPPYLSKPLMDDVLVPFEKNLPVDKDYAYWLLAGMALAAILSWMLNWVRLYVLARVSELIAAGLRNKTYEHMQRLSMGYFSGRRTGDLIARVSNDTDRICYFLSVYVIDFCSDIVMLLLIVPLMVKEDPKLALMTLLPLPFIAGVVQLVRNKLRAGFAAGGRAWSDLTSILADTIPGIRVVKAFAQEQREIDRFRDVNTQVVEANDRVNKVWSFFTPLITLMTDLGELFVYAAGVWYIFHGNVSLGTLTAFLAYLRKFYVRLDGMSRMSAAVQRAAASAHRIFEVLDMQSDVPVAPNAIKPGRIQGSVEFRDVQFRYGNRKVIRGVSFSIKPGEMVGVVGPSGSGKTTLINLACRFFDVSEGAVLIDGVDIRQLDVEDYRRNIGLVLQEPFLFFGSIFENIAYGKPQATRAEIIAAAKAARAHEFILKLADGYDSLVGERGQQLSGGERQRISIARALLINPALLILDEATSAVDTETEREIQLALENLIRGRTTIAIAHRLSTLHTASRLVVLEDGKITQLGPHSELINQPGTYARLHEAQQQMARGELPVE